MIDPTLLLPDRQRLGCIHREEVQLCIVLFFTEPRAFEPRRRKFLAAIIHVLAAEDAQFEHFFGRQFRFEIRMEILASAFGEIIDIILLHQVVDLDCNSPS